MMKPTEKQAEILQYLKSRTDPDVSLATYREIADKHSMTVKGAWDHVRALEKKGLVHCEPRGIRIIKTEDSDVENDRT